MHLLQFNADCFEIDRCLDHGLKMCILFGHNPQIIFCHFFHKIILVIFAAKMNRY